MTVTDARGCCTVPILQIPYISPPTGSAATGSWAGSANPVGRHTRRSGAWWWWQGGSTRPPVVRSSPRGSGLFGRLPLKAWRWTENTHTHLQTQKMALCSDDTTVEPVTGMNTALGCWCARWRCLPHGVLPLNRHVHLVNSALRNGPSWNQQTHPWGVTGRERQGDTYDLSGWTKEKRKVGHDGSGTSHGAWISVMWHLLKKKKAEKEAKAFFFFLVKCVWKMFLNLTPGFNSFFLFG